MKDWQDKLTKIEALLQRTTSDGEREAARLAKERLLEKVAQEPVEYQISHHDLWKKRLFLALCQKYDVSSYRYKGQKHTTSMVRINPTIMREYLWPEYQRYAKLLEECLEGILDDLMSKMQGMTSETIVERSDLVLPFNL